MAEIVDSGRRSATVRLLAIIAAGAAGWAGFPSQGEAAESAADYYRGRTLRLVVGSGAGGGYDSYARMLAPFLAKELAGEVLVENRPGAGGLLALNQIFDADPDGLLMMIVSGSGAALAQLLGQEGADFDLQRMTWIAGLGADTPIVMLNPHSTVHTLTEMMAADHPVKWAASGRSSGQGLWITFFTHALAIPSNLITGYKGSNEASLAAMRGEVDGIIVTATSAHSYALDGQLLPIAAIGHERSSLFPDLPTVFEQATLTAEAGWWMEYCVRTAEVSRTVIGPPDLPAERAQFLQDAFQKLLTDPAVLSAAAAADRILAYQTPDFVRGRCLDLLTGVDQPHRDMLKALLVGG